MVSGITTASTIRRGRPETSGEAQLTGSCAVVSLHRLREEFYGLRHCDDWRCVMTSSHAVERLDIKGAQFCILCGRAVARARTPVVV
jgi:predicted Zn-dependent protease